MFNYIKQLESEIQLLEARLETETDEKKIDVLLDRQEKLLNKLSQTRNAMVNSF